jgi:hypothetical protein
MNGTWTDVFPGTCIYSPRGSVHAFKNNTDQPIRVFMNIAPTGFEHFFAEVAEEWARPERDMSRITAISEKYGIIPRRNKTRVCFPLNPGTRQPRTSLRTI